MDNPQTPSAIGARFEPGQFVRHPDNPDWGIGQVQSVVGDRVTVNFQDRGKVTMNVAVARLDAVDDAP